MTEQPSIGERILDARDNVSYAQLSQELSSADEALNLPRMVGDAAIAAFFSADKPKDREKANGESNAAELTETAGKDPTSKASDLD